MPNIKFSQFDSVAASELELTDELVGLFANATDDNGRSTLAALKAKLLEHGGSYVNLAALVASTTLKVGDYAFTLGHTTAGDGGAGLYKIVAAGTGHQY